MRLISRLLSITGKAVRLGLMLTLVRCFGTDGAAYLLASVRMAREQVETFFRDLFSPRRMDD